MRIIQRFEEDDSRTPLSAEVMNQIVDAINRKIVGRGKIRVTESDANIVISLEDDDTSGQSSIDQTVMQVSGSSGGSGDTFICNCRYV